MDDKRSEGLTWWCCICPLRTDPVSGRPPRLSCCCRPSPRPRPWAPAAPDPTAEWPTEGETSTESESRSGTKRSVILTLKMKPKHIECV